MRLDGWIVNLEVPKTAFDTDKNTPSVSCGLFGLIRSELVLIAVNAKRRNGGIIMNGDQAVITCILFSLGTTTPSWAVSMSGSFWVLGIGASGKL